jgi:hypothetical protein
VEFVVSSGIPPSSALSYASWNYTSGKGAVGIVCNMSAVRYPGILVTRGYYSVTSDRLKRLVYNGVVIVGIQMTPALRAVRGSGAYLCPDILNINITANNYISRQPWIITQINHYVLVVGYDSSTNFIFKNSYGTTYGDGGYGKVINNHDCGIRVVAYQLWSTRIIATVVAIVILIISMN